MRKRLLLIFACSIILSILGCGEDSLITRGSQQTFSQHIFVVPTASTGLPYHYQNPRPIVYLDLDDDMRLWAGYAVNGEFLTPDSASNLFISHFWTLNKLGSTEQISFNVNSFRYIFDQVGAYRAILQTIDLFNDTLQDTVLIYVNSPLSIKSLSPINGYNLVDPNSEDGIFLQWDTEGIDDWEESICEVYASLNKKTVWDNLLGISDCSGNVLMSMPILNDDAWLQKKNINLNDSSLTFYWGIKVTTFTEDGFEEADSTEIFHFSTLFSEGDSAKLVLPIRYNGLNGSVEANTVITLINFNGDTVKTIHNNDQIATLEVSVPPQVGLKVIAQELSRTEYVADTIILDIPKRAKIVSDTIEFNDFVPPQIAPLKNSFNADENIKFYILDNGAGINSKRISINIETDNNTTSIPISLTEDIFISFNNDVCPKSCKISFSISDNAHNSLPNTHWILNHKDGIAVITGPFSEEEE